MNSRYPENWHKIALKLKQEANWKCAKCGMQCLKPNENTKGLSKSERSKRTLTVHHKNYQPEDNRSENLICLCTACHLSYLMLCKDKTINNKYKEQQQQQFFSLYNFLTTVIITTY